MSLRSRKTRYPAAGAHAYAGGDLLELPAEGWSAHVRHHPPAPVRPTGPEEALPGEEAAWAEPGARGRKPARRLVRGARAVAWLMLLALGIALPPLLLVYLIAWLVWRRRPESRAARLRRRAARVLKRAREAYARGALERTLKGLQQAHLFDPRNDEVLLFLGQVLGAQGRHSEAVEALTVVDARRPGLPAVDAALARSYFAQGQHEQAIRHAQRVLNAAAAREEPGSVELLLMLAESFEALQQPEFAIETLRRAPLEAHRLDEDLKRVHYRLGELYEAVGDPQMAAQHFRRIYAQDIGYRDVKAKVTGG